MKYNNELKELNEFLLNKFEDIEEIEKMINNTKFQLLIDRIFEIEWLKNKILEIEVVDEENDDELEYLNEVLTLNLENYKNFKKIVSNKRYKEIVSSIIKMKETLLKIKNDD